MALALLALSASVVVAAKPETMPDKATSGLTTAWQKSSLAVPMAGAEAVSGAGKGANQETDETADADESPAALDAHGTVVSDAARSDTPEGYANHGDFVSSVALDNAGQAQAAANAAEHSTGAAAGAGAGAANANENAGGRGKP